MSRPFPDTFDNDPPKSSQSAVSYQTNVSRQKTRKWAEAKAVDYGGDDWGDDDEYDLPPPPTSKPTGLRKQGQGLPGLSTAASPPKNRKYGDLPPLPGASNSRGRANSFDADDETRNFSNASIQPAPSATNVPPSAFSQTTGAPTTRDPATPVAESSQADVPAQRPGRANTGERSLPSEKRLPSAASDFHGRRDYSPPVVPSPLSTHASPAPESAANTPNRNLPPRGTTLSQSFPASPGDNVRPASDGATPKPLMGSRSATPGSNPRPPTSPTNGKALPFIRPADIYKRAEEERRASIDSARRPSIDSLGSSGAPAKPHLDEKSSSDSLGGNGRGRSAIGNDEHGDSGRRLSPTLESVTERKSEYGLDSANVNEHAPQSGDVDIEEAIRLSTSPKLPDFARMSGFGLDMFSPHDVGDSSKEPETPPTTTTTTTSSSPEEELKLRTQPSIGFNSVVHQAFDRTDDQSDLNTPASRSGSSGMRRTDSESTSGISPIMSRVSSTAVPETRSRTSAILETPEPASPDPRDDLSQSVRGFKPGHRRDLSTPSPGNSPARTPDLVPHTVPDGQRAVVDDTTLEVVAPAPHESVPAARPVADREPSFRPSLPGGWTSYATTSLSETSNQSAEGPLTGPNPVAETTSVGEDQHDDGNDLTPTAAKSSPPHAAIDGHEYTSPPQSPVLEKPETVAAVSATSLGKQMHSVPHPTQLEQAPTQTQLRPDAGDNSPTTMSVPPTPPPKDTPGADYSSEGPDSPPSTKDSPKQKTHDAPNVDDPPSPERPELLTRLSTDSWENDEESDKLRKEIVRSLSPRPPNVTALNHSTPPHAPDDSRNSIVDPQRESTYLPQEYDSYWGSNEQDKNGPPILEVDVNDPSKAGQARAESPNHSALDSSVPPIAPLSPRNQTEGALQDLRPAIDHRLSWEGSSENISTGVDTEASYFTIAGNPSGSFAASELPGSEVPVKEEKQFVPQDSDQSLPQESPAEHHSARDAALLTGGAELAVASMESDIDKPEDKSRRLSFAEEKVALDPVSSTSLDQERPPHSSQEQFPNSSDSAAQPPGPPSTVSPLATPAQPTSSVAPTPPGRLIAFREIIALKSAQERIQTFDETRQRFANLDSGLNEWMLQLQSQFPDEHGDVSGSWGAVQTSVPSGSARSKFSKVISSVAAPQQQPYYQQYLNASSPNTSLSPASGGGASGLRPSPSFSAGSHSFSPSGTKLSTQQVQAKGKELLHTAGIFGGKAGKVGKGLLAKGKNKLAARGGDKTINSNTTTPSEQQKESEPERDQAQAKSHDPTKSKADRRSSSWGLLSRQFRDSGIPGHSRPSAQQGSGQGQGQISKPPPDGGLDLGMSGALPVLPEFTPLAAEPIGFADDYIDYHHPVSSAGSVSFGDGHGHALKPGEGEDGEEEWSMVPPGLRGELNEGMLDWSRGSLSHPLPTHLRPESVGGVSELSRPRGSSSHDGSPLSSHGEGMPSPLAGSLSISPPSTIAGPEQVSPSAPTAAARVEHTSAPARQEESSTSSFLPPLRRASSFGLGFSPERPEQRSPIEDSKKEQDSVSVGRNHQPVPRQQQWQEEPPAASPGTEAVANVLREGEDEGDFEQMVPGRRPLSFRLSPPLQLLGERKSASPVSDVSGPDEETNTWGIREDHVHAAPTYPHHFVAEKQDRRDDSSPPPGYVVDGEAYPASGIRNIGEEKSGLDLSPTADTNTWGVMEEYIPPVPSASVTRRELFFPPPGFAVDALAHPPPDSGKDLGLSSPCDTDTWGVRRDSMPPPFPGASVPSMPLREASFPPPGFVCDGPAHPTVPVTNPVKESEAHFQKSTSEMRSIGHQRIASFSPFRSAPRTGVVPDAGFIDPISHRPLPFVRTSNNQRDPPLPLPAFAASKPLRGRSPHQLPRLQTGSVPQRPLSFQRTPPRGLDTTRRPSFARDLTKEPEALGTGDEAWDEKDALPSGTLSRADSLGTLASDPEKEEIAQSIAALEQHAVNQTQTAPRREPPAALFNPPRAAEILQRPEFKESHVEWRPNRPKVAAKPQLSFSSDLYSKETSVEAARVNSWDTGFSGSSSAFQRQNSDFVERGGYTSLQQANASDLPPPTSTSRFPELFRLGQQSIAESPRAAVDDHETNRDLPDHLFQAHVSRTQALLPRQLAGECQLPGVEPLPDINPTRRNSALLRGKLSRVSSPGRSNSLSRSPHPILDSRVESSLLSPEDGETRGKRSNFFGHLRQNAHAGSSPPKSRESVVAHPGSRPDLPLATPQPAPARRSLFRGEKRAEEKGSGLGKDSPQRLVRQSTTGTMNPAGQKKEKHRFSLLGGLFGKPSKERLQSTRQVELGKRKSIENPMPEEQLKKGGVNRVPGFSGRAVGSELLEKPRDASKMRRTSAGGLLESFLGRKEGKKEKGSEVYRDQGSQSVGEPPSMLGLTYTDLQQREPESQPEREQLRREPAVYPPQQDRGQREPQYDSVLIPSGYALVRGQGSMAVPSEYDLRGFHHHTQQHQQQTHIDPYQQSLASSQLPSSYQHSASPIQPYAPNLSTQDAYSPSHHHHHHHHHLRAGSVPSREDLLARSPPRFLPDQQRPWQISLPLPQPEGLLVPRALGEGERGNARRTTVSTVSTAGGGELERTAGGTGGGWRGGNLDVPMHGHQRAVSLTPPSPMALNLAWRGEGEGERDGEGEGEREAEEDLYNASPRRARHYSASSSYSSSSAASSLARVVAHAHPDGYANASLDDRGHLRSPGHGPGPRHGHPNAVGGSTGSHWPSTLSKLDAEENAQEEKILCAGGSGGERPGQEDEDEDEGVLVKMSATSYPGQEWNPFGASWDVAGVRA